MKTKLTTITILAATLLCLPASDRKPESDRPMLGFMREKIGRAGAVLEGITLENYHMAITNAVVMRDMNFTNTFFGVSNPYYLQNITNFQAQVDKVIAAARARNLDKATDAYASLARSCVECHKEFRRAQFTQHQRKSAR